MKFNILVFLAALATAAPCAAQTRGPAVAAPNAHLQAAPATAFDVQALRNENQALKQRIDALVQALNLYAACERTRVHYEGQSGDSVSVQPPQALACGGAGQEAHLHILENIH